MQTAARVSGDFAFKRAYALRNERTMVSVLNNLMRRIGADAAMMAQKDRRLIASTVDVGATGTTFRFASLIEAAIDAGDNGRFDRVYRRSPLLIDRRAPQGAGAGGMDHSRLRSR